jgi:hypothetical protein
MIEIRHCIPVDDKPIRNPQQLNTHCETLERWNVGTSEPVGTSARKLLQGILEACATTDYCRSLEMHGNAGSCEAWNLPEACSLLGGQAGNTW